MGGSIPMRMAAGLTKPRFSLSDSPMRLRRLFQHLRRLRGGEPRAADQDFARLSFAQEGEDLILEELFFGKADSGFYVDVGALHPHRYSNTYFFYRKGWRGINIDATPGSMEPFVLHRPRDINLQQAIALRRQPLAFYLFNDPALNSFSKEISEARQSAHPQYRIVGTVEMETLPLKEVLDRHLPPGQKIDFLTIDAEGLDLDVLRSNDWDRYAPDIVLTESLDCRSASALLGSELHRLLDGLGYDFAAKTLRTAFYRRRRA